MLKVAGSGINANVSIATDPIGSPFPKPRRMSSTLPKSTLPNPPVPIGTDVLKSTIVSVVPFLSRMSKEENVSIAELREREIKALSATSDRLAKYCPPPFSLDYIAANC